MRLIDADALHEIINWTLFKPPYSKRKVHRFIDDAPTIEERKTGKWIQEIIRHEYGSTVLWKCSSCGKMATGMYNYCPNCGARMVEE